MDKYAQKEIIKQPGPAWLPRSARVQQQSSPCVYKIPRINRRNQRQIPAERSGSLVKNQVTRVKLIVWQSCLTPHVRPGLMDYQYADNHSHKCAGQPDVWQQLCRARQITQWPTWPTFWSLHVELITDNQLNPQRQPHFQLLHARNTFRADWTINFLSLILVFRELLHKSSPL